MTTSAMMVSDRLRGELERLFELDELRSLSSELLGLGEGELGGQPSKGAFARALVDRCVRDEALPALVDAVQYRKKMTFSLEGEELPAGFRVGDYTVSRELGRSALGITYLAEDAKGGKFALKALAPLFSQQRAATQRWQTALRAQSTSDLKGIVGIVETGLLPDGRVYALRPFVDAPTLATRLSRTGPMGWNEAKHVLADILQSLETLHAKGLAHGNLKTENVFLREAEGDALRVALVDGGSDRLFLGTRASAGVESGVFGIVGHPNTVAPEQIRRGEATPSSDLYAAAAVAYEMITGKPVFEGDSAFEIFAKHLTAKVAAPSTRGGKGTIASEVDEVLVKALSKEPSERFSSAKQFREGVVALFRGSIAPGAEVFDEKAFEAAAKELRKKPNDEEIATKIDKLIEPANAYGKAAELFVSVASETKDKNAKKSLLFRAARIFETDLADHARSEKIYREILELSPDDDVARGALEELLRITKNGQGLVDLLLDRVDRETSSELRAQILSEIADTFERLLSDPEQAFVAWVQALSETGADARAIREVERLAKTDAQWNEALTILNDAAKTAEDPATKVQLFNLLAKWYSGKVLRPDFAVQCYAQTLALEPANEAALDGMSDLYQQGQSWQELAQILVVRAQATTNPVRGRNLRARAARVLHEHLGQTAGAEEIYREILKEDPAHVLVTEAMAEILAERGEFARLASMLESKAQQQRDFARAETLSELADVYETKLNDIDRAAAHFQAALVAHPGFLPALQGLERVYAKKNAPEDLLKNLKSQLDLVATPRQRITLLERIGSLHEEEFFDFEKAISTFGEIVSLSPAHEAANRALVRLLRQAHRFEELAELLSGNASRAEDQERKTELLVQSAQVLLVDVGAPSRAAETLEKALAVRPNDRSALELVARTQAQLGDSKAALSATKRLADGESDPKKKIELLFHTARLLARAGDKDGAVIQYKAVLDIDPNHEEAAEEVRNVFIERGDVAGAERLIEKALETTTAPNKKAALLATLGDLYREKKKDSKKATETYARALSFDPTHVVALLGTATIAADAGKSIEAANAFEALLSRTSELDADTRLLVCLRAADVFQKENRLEQAERALVSARAFAPEDSNVLARWADVALLRGNNEDAVELYEELLTKHGKDLVGLTRGQVLVSFGKALAAVNKNAEAIKRFEEADGFLPGSAEALTELASLYQKTQKWSDAARVLTRISEGGREEARFQALVELGDLYFEKLSDKKKAGAAYTQALEYRTDDRRVLAKLLSVSGESKDWNQVLDVVLRLADLTDENGQRARYFYTAGSLTLRELRKSSDAAIYFERAFELDPKHDKAFEALVSQLKQDGKFDRLEKAFRHRLELLEAEHTAGGYNAIDLAKVYDSYGDAVRESKPAEAIRAYARALQLDSEDRRRAEILAELYGKDTKKYAEEAIAVHGQLLEKNPYRIESFQALRKLYTDAKRPDESWCVCQALVTLKSAEPDEDNFYRKHKKKSPLSRETIIEEELFEKKLAHHELDPLVTDILQMVVPAVLAVRSQEASAFGLNDSHRVQEAEGAPDMVRYLTRASKLFAGETPALYKRNDDPGGLSFVFTKTPSIGLGTAAFAEAPSQAVGFLAGRQASFLRGAAYLTRIVPTAAGLRTWLLGAIRTTVPTFPCPPELIHPATEAEIAIRKNLSGPSLEVLRALVGRLLADAPDLDLLKWAQAIEFTADRAGFVFTNNLELALAVVKASGEEAFGLTQQERSRELTQYSVSKEYLELRQALGIAIGAS